jgi:hypothetical protein
MEVPKGSSGDEKAAAKRLAEVELVRLLAWITALYNYVTS